MSEQKENLRKAEASLKTPRNGSRWSGSGSRVSSMPSSNTTRACRGSRTCPPRMSRAPSSCSAASSMPWSLPGRPAALGTGLEPHRPGLGRDGVDRHEIARRGPGRGRLPPRPDQEVVEAEPSPAIDEEAGARPRSTNAQSGRSD